MFISFNTVNCCLLLLQLRQLSLEQTTLNSRLLVQMLVSKAALENRLAHTPRIFGSFISYDAINPITKSQQSNIMCNLTFS